jgi:hypothetical protein
MAKRSPYVVFFGLAWAALILGLGGVVYAATSAGNSPTRAAASGGGGGGTITLSGAVTGSGTTSITTAFGSVGSHSYVGNNTGSPAAGAAITATQLTADLNLATSSLQGLVPGSGGGTTNFLRADFTWAAPSGGSLSPQADQTLFGNTSGSTASPSSMTASQARAVLGVFIPVAASNLTDASVTINPTNSVMRYVLPAATPLTQPRTITLGYTGTPDTYRTYEFVRVGTGAFLLDVVDSTSGVHLCVFSAANGLPTPSGTVYPLCRVQYNGSIFITGSLGEVTQ